MTLTHSAPLTLPGREIHSDPSILEQEAERIFAKSWCFLGFESEIPEPGDYVLRSLGLDKVVLTRLGDGGIGCVLNSCTHRGAELCRADFGNSTHFRCSYHGWTFNGQGTLVAVPRLKTSYAPTFDKACLSLPSARVESYRGFVFATWDHDAEPLTAHLGDVTFYLDAILDMFDGEWVPYAEPQRVLSPGNWKLQTENFVGDGYHLETTHKTAMDSRLFGDLFAGTGSDGSKFHLVGYQVRMPQGHGLRTLYLEDAEGKPFRAGGARRYVGFPDDQTDAITQRLTPEQQEFHDGLSGMHGAIFPNVAFLYVAHSDTVGEPGEPLTTYFCWRVHVPAGPHETEIVYWTLVPKSMPEEWRKRSYTYQARTQSAGGMYFEADDFENFARIDDAGRGPVGRSLRFDYSLARDVCDAGDAAYVGPGAVDKTLVSEVNQRNFYRRWAELMDQAPQQLGDGGGD